MSDENIVFCVTLVVVHGFRVLTENVSILTSDNDCIIKKSGITICFIKIFTDLRMTVFEKTFMLMD